MSNNMIKAQALVIAVSGAIAFYGNVAIATINQEVNLPNRDNQEEVQKLDSKILTGVKKLNNSCVLINGIKYCT
ncbi:hypothetical protein IQ259_09865 [Fortiea sp. LEGE XX443]|uniref:hypothetical protein n=1 Tax=Fortiea sp. LEGE XX443 TaxID=1828611 RepID=UPI0018824834|nr:hypothetical protein [Fortiea sp. LEGE XX443]MBE9005341.1 hypothetical protein [Fortiea sp. LEGE XX443]